MTSSFYTVYNYCTYFIAYAINCFQLSFSLEFARDEPMVEYECDLMEN